MDDAQPRSILKRGAKRTLWLRAGHGPHGDVVVKRFHAPGFFDRLRDRARAAGEARALRALLERGLPVPEPVSIERRAGGVELVMRWIDGALTLAEVVRTAHRASPRKLARIARAVGSLLARAALCGLRHPDLHAGNVLVDARGRAWFVDVRRARVGSPLRRDEHERALVVLAADVRERTTARMRARVLAACNRELRRAGHTDLTITCSGARTVERAACLRRRAVVERSSRRWLRTSSVTVPFERMSKAGRERGVRACHADEAQCRRAVEAGAGIALERIGKPADVRAAWRTAARLCEHGIPACVPVVLLHEPRMRAVFATSAGSGLAPAFDGARTVLAVEGDPGSRSRAARSLGRLFGRLHDRALIVTEPWSDAVVFDARDGACVAVGARLSAIDPDEAGPVLAAARPLLRRASRIERARACVEFLRALQSGADEIAALRARLRAGDRRG